MTTRYTLGALTVALMLGLTSSFAAAQSKSVVKFGSGTIHDTVHNLMTVYEARVEQRDSERIDVQVFPASQLGSMFRQIEMVQLGSQEMAAMPPEFLVGVDRRFGLLAAPGVFDDIAHAHRTVNDPEFREVFWSLGEAKGVKGMGMYCSDQTSYVSPKPMRSLADFRGKKIRVFASPTEIEVLRILGASAAPMPLSDVLPSLQRGVIDGVKAGLSIFVPFKFYDSAKYMTRTLENVVCVMHFASKSWFDRLPGDVQSVLIEEGAKAGNDNLEFALKFDEENQKRWTDAGGVLLALTPEERESLRERVSVVGDKLTADKPEDRAVYDLIKRVAARTR